MTYGLLAVGIACLLVGAHNVVRRDAIVARHRRRAGTGHLQVPMAYAVSGGIVALAGFVMILGSVIQLA